MAISTMSSLESRDIQENELEAADGNVLEIRHNTRDWPVSGSELQCLHVFQCPAARSRTKEVQRAAQ